MDFWLRQTAFKKDPDEAFAVILDDDGENLEAAIRQGVSQGIQEFVFLRFGRLSNRLTRKVLPGVIEKVRRDFLGLDFHYARG